MMSFKKKRDYIKKVELERPVEVDDTMYSTGVSDFGEVEELTNLFLNKNQSMIEELRALQEATF